MRKNHSRAGIVLAFLVALVVASCGPETDRSVGDEEPSGAGAEASQEARRAWEAFRLGAEKDLDALAQKLGAIRQEAAELERAQVDRWADRVERARKEVAKEMAEAPEQRRRAREELKSEIEEIERGVQTLLAELRDAEPASPGEGSEETL